MRFLRSISFAAAAALAAFSYSGPAAAGDHGDAVIAGVGGFAVGALLGNALARPAPPRYVGRVYVAPPPPPVVYQPQAVYYYGPEPWTPEWYSYCARKYGSFDARSGTYLGYDGFRHMCQ